MKVIQQPKVGLTVLKGTNCTVKLNVSPGLKPISLKILRSGEADVIELRNEFLTDKLDQEQRLDDLEANQGNDLNFVHDQTTASNVWNVTHGLGKYPSIKTVDTANTEVKGDEEYLDQNNVRITFGTPIMGKAYIN